MYYFYFVLLVHIWEREVYSICCVRVEESLKGQRTFQALSLLFLPPLPTFNGGEKINKKMSFLYYGFRRASFVILYLASP